jgi:hypothetical protein
MTRSCLTLTSILIGINVLTFLVESLPKRLKLQSVLQWRSSNWKSIKNLTIQNKIKGMNKDDQLIYWKSEDSKEDLIQECMHHLKLKIFGSDYLGQSAYIQLRRIIRTFRVRLDPGICAYDTRVTALNNNNNIDI